MSVLQTLVQTWNDRSSEPVFEFVDAGAITQVSFATLLRRVKAFAAEFIRRGIRPGEVVIVIMRHRLEMIDAFLGALWIGAVPSFIPAPSDKQEPEHFWTTHMQLFQRIGARLLVTDLVGDPGNTEWFGKAGCEIWDINGAAFAEAPDAPMFQASLEQTAFLQHSSGTTAQKKGVMLSHRAVLAQVSSYGQNLQLSPGQTIVSWLPLYHDMGLIACFILPLLTGLRTVLLSPFEWVREPFLLLDLMERFQAEFVWLPNFAFHLLAMTKPPHRTWQLGQVKAFINCSEPCKPDTFRVFQEAFSASGVRPNQLQVCYALAEAVFAVTQTGLGEAPLEVVADSREFHSSGMIVPANGTHPSVAYLSAGRPIDGMQVRILNDAEKEEPDNVVGEIAISGLSLFEGYYRAPANARSYGHGAWYATGDLGFLRQGNLFVTGRKRDVLIIRGKKYHGYDIEHIAGGVSGVKMGRCAAFPVENRLLGTEDAVLVLELDEKQPATSQAKLIRDIKTAVYDELGLILSDISIVPARWINKTTSGKISRMRNAEKYLKEKYAYS